jgi:NAD(P)-dependent dehydrogenase (short-subunit alcohol dehydrogenase family)
LFTYELHRRLAGSDVTANALHPGFVRTGLGTKHVIWPLRPFVAISFLWGMSPEAGAATSIKLASDPALEGDSGKYYAAGRQIRSSARSYDEQAAMKLWEISTKLTGIKSAGPLPRTRSSSR